MGKVLLIINLVLINGMLVYLWKRPNVIETKTVVQNNYVYPTPSTSSGQEPTMLPTKTIVINKKTMTTSVIPIPGSGEILENSWTDIKGTEFNLNTGDYTNIKEAYLEVNMRLFNGNGMAYARLFDVTAGIEVWGSEVNTNNQNFTVVTSGKLTLRPGNHLYRIQAKSLTADTTVYNSGRIKLVTEN